MVLMAITISDWFTWDPLNIVLVLLGVMVGFNALFSEYLKRIWLNNTIMAMTVGIICSESVTGLLDIQKKLANANVSLNSVIEQSARIVVGIQLVSTGLKLPPTYFNKDWKSQVVLLGLVMPLTWISSSLLTWLFMNVGSNVHVGFWESLLFGATVAPTDPVLAAAVVQGRFAEKHLTEKLRQMLSAESGANDGLAFPMVLLPLFILTRPTGEAMWFWFVNAVFYQVVIGILLGVLVGYVAALAFEWSERKLAYDEESFFALSLALSLFVLGAGRMIGLDEILSSFVVGVVFSMVVIREEIENIQGAVDSIFTISFMFLFGLIIPWGEWVKLGWGGVLTTISILLFRRLPFVFLFRRLSPNLRNKKEAFIVGWFGPVGVAALFYFTFLQQLTDIHFIFNLGTQVVFGSTLLHGITAVPFSKIFKKYSKKEVAEDKKLPPSERMIPAPEAPIRRSSMLTAESLRSSLTNQHELEAVPKQLSA